MYAFCFPSTWLKHGVRVIRASGGPPSFWMPRNKFGQLRAAPTQIEHRDHIFRRDHHIKSISTLRYAPPRLRVRQRPRTWYRTPLHMPTRPAQIARSAHARALQPPPQRALKIASRAHFTILCAASKVAMPSPRMLSSPLPSLRPARRRYATPGDDDRVPEYFGASQRHDQGHRHAQGQLRPQAA